MPDDKYNPRTLREALERVSAQEAAVAIKTGVDVETMRFEKRIASITTRLRQTTSSQEEYEEALGRLKHLYGLTDDELSRLTDRVKEWNAANAKLTRNLKLTEMSMSQISQLKLGDVFGKLFHLFGGLPLIFLKLTKSFETMEISINRAAASIQRQFGPTSFTGVGVRGVGLYDVTRTPEFTRSITTAVRRGILMGFSPEQTVANMEMLAKRVGGRREIPLTEIPELTAQIQAVSKAFGYDLNKSIDLASKLILRAGINSNNLAETFYNLRSQANQAGVSFEDFADYMNQFYSDTFLYTKGHREAIDTVTRYSETIRTGILSIGEISGAVAGFARQQPTEIAGRLMLMQQYGVPTPFTRGTRDPLEVLGRFYGNLADKALAVAEGKPRTPEDIDLALMEDRLKMVDIYTRMITGGEDLTSARAVAARTQAMGDWFRNIPPEKAEIFYRLATTAPTAEARRGALEAVRGIDYSEKLYTESASFYSATASAFDKILNLSSAGAWNVRPIAFERTEAAAVSFLTKQVYREGAPLGRAFGVSGAVVGGLVESARSIAGGIEEMTDILKDSPAKIRDTIKNLKDSLEEEMYRVKQTSRQWS